MPDAAWAVSVHPPSLSREKGQPPVLTSSNPLSTLHRRFAYARLSQSCLPESRSGFPQRSPPWLLTTAACGGLRPAPDCRPRRAHLHLSYSCTCRLDRHARDTRPFADMRAARLGIANGIKPDLKCDFLLAPDMALGTRKSSWNRVWRSTVQRLHALHLGRIVPILQKRKAANSAALKFGSRRIRPRRII